MAFFWDRFLTACDKGFTPTRHRRRPQRRSTIFLAIEALESRLTPFGPGGGISGPPLLAATAATLNLSEGQTFSGALASISNANGSSGLNATIS
jgi:hypothetical protein